MAKFDVYRGPEGAFWLDCQNDLFADLNTRFVVPLELPRDAICVDRRLNPTLVVDGEDMLMLTHFAAAVGVRTLGAQVANLVDQDIRIGNALDMLISGF